jgi:hypothetical protein
MKYRPSGSELLLLMTILLGAPGCHPVAKHQTLPDKIPTPPDLRLTGREEGWPPRPQGRTSVANVPWSARAGALSETLVAELRATALQDARVRTALGERFGYITAAEVEPAKESSRGAGGPASVRLTFYSYTNNGAVEVLVRERVVERVNRREGYQPPEGAEEIRMAIALAERDSRLREGVQNMRATAIVTDRERGQPGYGHRVLHVSFSATDEDVPRYYALVDLTDQRIVTAGRVGER